MKTVKTKYFDYGQEEMDYLKSVDETLGEAMKRLGKIERTIIPDLFSALVYAIIGQLISAKAANTIWERMQNQFGEISPRNIAIQHTEDIQKCGMTMRKAACIKSISMLIVQGGFSLDDFHDLSDEKVISKLMILKGVGKWTAEMLLINSMERRDIVSWGDVSIRRGMMRLYGLSTLTKEQFEHYRLQYSPFGSVASIYLWEISME